MRIIITADPHIGLDRFQATPEEWDAPLHEAADYAIETNADLFVIAGDAQNNRNPTMAQHRRLDTVARKLVVAMETVVIDGNHDRGMQPDSVPVTAFSRLRSSGGAASVLGLRCGLQLVALPWPRPVDYGPSPYVLDADPQEATREGVLNKVNALCGALDPAAPAILVGHAMLTYGESSPDSPKLAFGKDVLLPASFFRDLPNIGACFFGHCHPPDDFYIGSTQPTDWSMAGKELSFIELLIEPDTVAPPAYAHANHLRGWNYRWRRIPYKKSIKLFHHEATFTDQQRLDDFISAPWGDPQQYHDVVKVTATLGPGVTLDPAAMRRTWSDVCRRVESVNIIPWRGEKRRSEMAGEGLAALDRTQIPEAVRAWAQERSQPPEIADRLAVDTRALQEEGI